MTMLILSSFLIRLNFVLLVEEAPIRYTRTLADASKKMGGVRRISRSRS